MGLPSRISQSGENVFFGSHGLGGKNQQTPRLGFENLTRCFFVDCDPPTPRRVGGLRRVFLDISVNRWRLNPVPYVSSNILSSHVGNILPSQTASTSLASTSCSGKENGSLSRPHSQNNQLATCDGTTFKWNPGSPFETYPFAIHSPTSPARPGYSLLHIDAQLSTVHIRSLICAGTRFETSPSCSSCQQAGKLLGVVMKRAAAQTTDGLADGFLSHSQLMHRLEKSRKEAKLQKLENLNTSKSITGLRHQQNTWAQIFEIIGTRHVPALHRIFWNAKSQGWGLGVLLERLQMAVEGSYRPHSYSKLELDLATTIYELGGGAALHALHHSPFSFPARTTILAHRKDYRLRISTGSILMEDLLANIETMFKDTKPDHTRVGMTLMLDEIASDGRLGYLSESDDIVGLCEHASTLPSAKMGDNLDVIMAIARAIREGLIHIGQEMLVAAFSRNGLTDYGARPVLLLPTCKQGSYLDAVLIIAMLREAWRLSPYGEALHGPLWSIASDGDPKRRPALYLHCMVKQLQPADPLFQHLSNLPGLNLWTGSHGETQDLDYKHDFKRVCKLLCTREGILVKRVVINKSLLAQWLERLTNVDWSENPIYTLLNTNSANSSSHERVHALLSPKDTQDVPRAIKLLNLTADIRKLDSSNFNPSERTTYTALALLGEMLEAVLEPFINPDLTLSEQITSLVKFAHIAFALFREHESDFMPNHLYSDLQCMVRTAIFRVAHTKNLDPNLKVFLCLLGDDVLEILFGRSRMIGGHSPNVDVEELRSRFASCQRLDAIFQDYPEWERRPSRLKLTRSRDVDHLSPRHWTKEIRASSCNLQVCYASGAFQAQETLAKAGYTYDFAKLFEDEQMSRDVDLMRPKGGKYPGISSEVDRSLGDGEAPVEGNSTTENVPTDSLDPRLTTFDGKAALEKERRERAERGKVDHSIWIKLDGSTPAHKKTILRTFMDPSLDIDYHKSHDRLLRVRYFSIGGDNWDRSCPSIYQSIQQDLFCLGSLYATVICTDKNMISLAVLHCTALKSGSQYIDQAPKDEIALPDSSWEVTGQILSLRPIPQWTPSDFSLSWVWDDSFVALDPITAKPRTQTQTSTNLKIRHLNFTTNGRIVYPLRPSQYSSTTLDADYLHVRDDLNALKGVDSTWLFREEDLKEIEQTLFKRLQTDEAAHSRTPVFSQVREGHFPYRASYQDPLRSFDHSTRSIPPPPSNGGPQGCLICHQQVAGPDRQNHVGTHVLRKIRGLEEQIENGGTVSLDYPCGFCGHSSLNGVCEVKIQSGKAISSCPHAYSFKIAPASKISKAKGRACTNVPIQCPFCKNVHWKYNILRHLQERHPSWQNSSGNDATRFRESINISDEEETRLGIPDEQKGTLSYLHTLYDSRRAGRIPSTQRTRSNSPPIPSQQLSSEGTQTPPLPHSNFHLGNLNSPMFTRQDSSRAQ